MMYSIKYLAHHGVKGQKWGVRRYQNKDGSLTEEGKEKYKSDNTEDGEKTEQEKTEEKIKTEERVKTLPNVSFTLALDPAAFVIDMLSKNGDVPLTKLPIVKGNFYISSILFMPVNAAMKYAKNKKEG